MPHGYGSEEQAEEHALSHSLDCGEDQVEFDHLQGDGDRPINVTVEDGGAVDLDPEFAHVEVVDGCNQSDQGTHVHRGLPLDCHTLGLHQEEDSGGHHRDRDDPEGDGDAVVGVEEPLRSNLGVHAVGLPALSDLL